MRRILGWLVTLVLVAIAAFAGGWAVRTLNTPVAAPPPEPPTTVTVTEGEVADTLTLGATVTWHTEPLGFNHAEGTLTALPRSGQTVNAGQVLYEVDARPVILARGEVPMYRDLARGDKGDDVQQLQEFLSDLGYLWAAPIGKFGPATETAVKQWQRDLGLRDDARVRRGDVMFLPRVPATVTPTSEAAVGRGVSGGDVVLSRLADDPSVSLSLTEGQRALVTEDMAVHARSPKGTELRGHIGGFRNSEQGFTADLRTKDDRPLCADVCKEFEQGDTLMVTVEQVTATKGLLVPVTAIETDAAGATWVRPAGSAGGDRDRVEVQVLAVADGQAAVEGDIASGDELIVGGA